MNRTMQKQWKKEELKTTNLTCNEFKSWTTLQNFRNLEIETWNIELCKEYWNYIKKN